MRRCRRFQEWISASLDGELEPAIFDLLRSHLSACEECRAAKRRYNWAKQVVSQLSGSGHAPASMHLWLSRLIELEVWRKKRKVIYLTGAGCTLFAALLIGTGVIFNASWPDGPKKKAIRLVKKEVVNDYVRSTLRPGEKVDFPASSREDVERWLQRHLDFQVKVPPLPEMQLELIGARVTYFLNRRVGGLLYKESEGDRFSSVLMMDRKGLNFRAKDLAPEDVDPDHQLTAWEDEEILYFLIGPRQKYRSAETDAIIGKTRGAETVASRGDSAAPANKTASSGPVPHPYLPFRLANYSRNAGRVTQRHTDFVSRSDRPAPVYPLRSAVNFYRAEC